MFAHFVHYGSRRSITSKSDLKMQFLFQYPNDAYIFYIYKHIHIYSFLNRKGNKLLLGKNITCSLGLSISTA